MRFRCLFIQNQLYGQIWGPFTHVSVMWRDAASSLSLHHHQQHQQQHQQQVLSVLVQRRVRPQHKDLRPDTLFTTITSLAAYPPTKVPPILCYRSRLRGISFLPALIEHYRAAGGRGRVQRGGKGGDVSLLTALLEAVTFSKSTKGRDCSFYQQGRTKY